MYIKVKVLSLLSKAQHYFNLGSFIASLPHPSAFTQFQFPCPPSSLEHISLPSLTPLYGKHSPAQGLCTDCSFLWNVLLLGWLPHPFQGPALMALRNLTCSPLKCLALPQTLGPTLLLCTPSCIPCFIFLYKYLSRLDIFIALFLCLSFLLPLKINSMNFVFVHFCV